MQVLNRSDPSRGHQGPASFLIMASGLDEVKIEEKKSCLFYIKILLNICLYIAVLKHGVDSKTPLNYSHVDIAGSAGKFPGNLCFHYFKSLLNGK